ncbi:MAG: TlpA family protein disulfide reductase [Nitrospirae bacterium]|nr:TlpA family protein disulfide reductase [Nitrospirota bacterium]
MNKIICVITILLLAASFSISEAADKPCFCLAPDKITQSPDFDFVDLNGNKIQLNQYTGKVVLLHFWATWCPACASEIPALNALREKFKGNDLVILAIAEDSQRLVEPFAKKLDMKYPIIIDQYGSMMRSYHVKALPYTFLINKKGNISCIAIGARDWTLSTIDSYLDDLLKE